MRFTPAFFFTVFALSGASVHSVRVLAEDPYPIEWTRQIGTSSFDQSHSVTVDLAGNVYIGGRTNGSLEGMNAGLGMVS